MRARFHPLLRLRLRHGFYAGGASTADFAVEAEAATGRRLRESGFLCLPRPDGVVIAAEVEDATTELLRRSLPGEGALRLILLLLPRHGHLYNITQLPDYRPGEQIFVFDNLLLDAESGDGRLFLGDAIAGSRLGPPVALLTSALLYPFAAATTSSTLRIRDRFGGLVFEEDIEAPAPGLREVSVDLQRAGLVAGRYRAEGDGGAPLDFFYLPGSFERPFAAVELWSRTDHVDPGGVDHVPAEHRFLVGDEIRDVGDFVLALPERATLWRYEVIKKYLNNGVALADLSIESPAATFTKTMTAERAVFTSTLDVALRERPESAVLKRNGTELMSLPAPRARTPLLRDDSGSYLSRLFVYV